MASSRHQIKKQDLRLVGTSRFADPALLHSGQDDETVVDVTEMADPDWDIRRDGRAWSGEEGLRRYALTPDRFELIEGKLLSSDEERRMLLGLLLENLGADAAVRLGDPQVWLEAITTAPARICGQVPVRIRTRNDVSSVRLLRLAGLTAWHDVAGIESEIPRPPAPLRLRA